MRLFAFAARLSAPVASRRSDRGPHALGDPGSSGARVREHRERLAGRRPLRGARRAAAVRGPWQLARARHGTHGGRRGPVGGHGRRSGPGGGRALRRAHRRPGHHGGRRRPDRGSAAPRLPGRVHQPSRAQGPDHRPRAHDHHRPAAEAVRDQPGDGRLLRADLAPRHPSRRHAGPDAARRHVLAGGDPRPAPPRSGRSGSARGRRRRRRRGQGLRTRRPDGRVDRERPAVARRARHRASRTSAGSPAAGSA